MNSWKFGEYIRSLLDEKEWKASTLAKKAGLSHVYVGSIIRGENPKTGKHPNLTIDTLQSLAKALNVPIELLIGAYLGRDPSSIRECSRAEAALKEALYQFFMEFVKSLYPEEPDVGKEILSRFIENASNSEQKAM